MVKDKCGGIYELNTYGKPLTTVGLSVRLVDMSKEHKVVYKWSV